MQYSGVSQYMVYNCVYYCDTCYIRYTTERCICNSMTYWHIGIWAYATYPLGGSCGSCITIIDTIILHIHTNDAYYYDNDIWAYATYLLGGSTSLLGGPRCCRGLYVCLFVCVCVCVCVC
jgi:hypothetical protein